MRSSRSCRRARPATSRGSSLRRWISARVCSTESCRWAATSARSSPRIRSDRSAWARRAERRQNGATTTPIAAVATSSWTTPLRLASSAPSDESATSAPSTTRPMPLASSRPSVGAPGRRAPGWRPSIRCQPVAGRSPPSAGSSAVCAQRTNPPAPSSTSAQKLTPRSDRTTRRPTITPTIRRTAPATVRRPPVGAPVSVVVVRARATARTIRRSRRRSIPRTTRAASTLTTSSAHATPRAPRVASTSESSVAISPAPTSPQQNAASRTSGSERPPGAGPSGTLTGVAAPGPGRGTPRCGRRRRCG